MRRGLIGRILVADDNEENRDLLRRRLERDGHAVLLAKNGIEALEVACAQPLDLILLDLMMPRLSGFDVLTRLHAAERTVHVPVIMISALDEMDSVVRCIEAGAEDYLPKPWNPVILQARVNACLEKKQLRDRERLHLETLAEAHRKSEALLLNILPAPVVGRLQKGEGAIADRYDDATVLFADIVGFTGFSAGLAASAVVEVLNGVFTAFDHIAGELGIEKIKTVGDAYMAVAGVPEPCEDHAARAARLALKMLDVAGREGARMGRSLELRIGLHSGPVVAGIIGTHKFAYDVWGDAVNVASRMEAHGLPGEIQASYETYERLREGFAWVPRGEIEVKGRGPMLTYLLKGAA
jgi:class 3 adenylate cyclase/CheY-like chemotaxis protein